MTIKEIVFHLNNVLEGKPWYGKSIAEILSMTTDLDENMQNIIGHMMAWRTFTLKMIKGENYDIKIDSEDDWPTGRSLTIPDVMQQFKNSNESIIYALKDKKDEWLREKVSDLSYNFQFLLEGIIQHDIYHLGQVALLIKTNKKA